MLSRVFIVALAAFAFAASASAQTQALWPGVTYEKGVQFTPRGPVALNILTGPRPGGTTALAPVLSNESLTGTETLTSMQRRIATSATAAGVNGDYFTFATGAPSGITMRDGQVLSPPMGARSSAGVTTDGTLDVRRVSFFGTWKGTGVARNLAGFNEPAKANAVTLYTQAWGPSTPAMKGAVGVVLFPFPAALPNVDLQAPAVEVRAGDAAVPIPIGGAVLVALGSAAERLLAEVPAGATVTTKIIFRPDWSGIVNAIGGGPQIVRNGAPVFRAGEAFTSSQLAPRAPRTGIGQRADGRVVMVAVDGRQPGYSVGMTNFELAQTLVRLGAVTGMALDGGGSTTMAFDGTLLSRPSDGRERPVATAFMFLYTGVFVPKPFPVVSPDGDGVGDEQQLRFKVVHPSTVAVTLTAPDGTVAYTETLEREPGQYDVAFPPAPQPLVPEPAPQPAPAPTPPSTVPTSSRALSATRSRTRDTPAEGRWQLRVSAVDDTGQQSQMTQTFTVNATLGHLETLPATLFLPPGGRDVAISWRQGREARVVVTVESPKGEVIRTLARRRYATGARPSLVWNGRDRGKKLVKGGAYLVRVVAKNKLGTIELTRKVPVRRIAGPPRRVGTVRPA